MKNAKNVARTNPLVKTMGIACAAGSIVTLVFLLLFSYIMSKNDMPRALSIFSMTALTAGGITAGFTAAKLHGKNGLLIGAGTGAILFSVIFVISMCVSESGFSATTPAKLAIAVLSSVVGSVTGVNFRMKKKY